MARSVLLKALPAEARLQVSDVPLLMSGVPTGSLTAHVRSTALTSAHWNPGTNLARDGRPAMRARP